MAGALTLNTSGSANTAVGALAVVYSNTGSYNVGVGFAALEGSGSAYLTGSYNTALGASAGQNLTSGSNNVIIGNDTGSTIATLSNYILLADGSGNRRMTINSAGNVGIGTASPQALLDVYGSGIYSAIIVPRATIAQRPTTAVNGMIRYQLDNNTLETYANGAWTGLATTTTTGNYLPLAGGTMTGAISHSNGTAAASWNIFCGRYYRFIFNGHGESHGYDCWCSAYDD